MPGIEFYRQTLRTLADFEPYLLAHSGLPGPRGNLELAHAVAGEADEAHLNRWQALGPDVAPTNTPGEFLAFCGVLGLGVLLARSAGAADPQAARIRERLRALAADERWRVREAVAQGLQLWGDADMAGLLAEMAGWAHGTPWEQRAAAAALCEPRLLALPEHAAAVLRILDEITASIRSAGDRKSPAFRVLRQGMGYCWSVAVAALPDAGKPAMEKWLAVTDPDIRWIMRENLKKNRLARVDPEWVARWSAAQ